MSQKILEIKKPCEDCGELFSIDDLHNCGTNVYCVDCADSHDYALCSDCGEYHIGVMYVNDRIVCDACFDSDKYFYCDYCDTATEGEAYTAYDSRNNEITICSGCKGQDFSTCSDCDCNIHIDSGFISTENGEIYCEINCCSDNYFYCEDCEDYRHNDYYGSEGRCENCEGTGLENIHSYSERPTPIFKGISSEKNHFIGFENEMELKNSDTSEVEGILENASGRLYFKEDSSLDNGFEIVSHPSTIKEHKKDEIKKLFEKLSSAGVRSHDTSTCGLHFHVERYHITPFTIDKIISFLSIHSDNLEVLARRKNNTYSRIKKLGGKKHRYYKNRERYEALNLQNEKTIEFRFFKGTLRYETFIASMQLCEAIVNFCRLKNSEKKLESWPAFEKFIFQEKSYIELQEYLKEKLL